MIQLCYIDNSSVNYFLSFDKLVENFYVYDVDAVKFNARQGKKRWTWGEVSEQKVPVNYFTKNGGSTTLKVKTESGLLLTTIKEEASKGLNYMDYDLSIDETAVKKYERWLNAEVKDKADHQMLKAADSKKYYLQKGTYELELSHGGKVEKKTLTIE